jgi:DNA polymerase-3 subunit gamma/tau
MLSKHAFNALLKTLEEPPEHVKFIFATTEVNKIPVTVLSRCQRFDLKRISSDDLFGHFSKILKLEEVTFEEKSLQLIAKYADGSARDGLSLLDQAIALSTNNHITYENVANMIGMSERTVVYDFLDHLFGENIEQALEVISQVHYNGQDSLKFVEDLLESVNLITKLKLISKLKNSKNLSEIEKNRAIPLSDKLSISVLSRTYQMLLKIYQEMQIAENATQALEMGAIRIYHLSQVPAMETMLKMLKDTKELNKTEELIVKTQVEKKEDKPIEKDLEIAPPPFPVDDNPPPESTAKK